MLLTQDIEKLVVHVNLKEEKLLKKNDDFAIVKAQAGEKIGTNLYFGASTKILVELRIYLDSRKCGYNPIQNIGAYGVEIKDTMFSCDAFEFENIRN